MSRQTTRPVRFAVWVLLAGLALAGMLHLGADFPNHSRWSDDAAKFTDEGWYAAGALNHALTGAWLRPGDFNPMVTIPLWPVLLAGIFHFSGISLVLARLAAFLFTLGSVLLAGRLFAREHGRQTPWLMLLMLSSPLLYVFSRLAILEAPLVFFLLASAVAAYYAAGQSGRTRLGLLVLCGLLFVLAMLTKSSAVFAAPGIFYLLWFPERADRGKALRAVAVPVLTVAILFGLYWMLAIRTHPVDARVLYSQNVPYLGLKSLPKAARIVYRSFTWIDPILFPLALVGLAASAGPLRRLWLDPLFGFAVSSYVGYAGFLLVHFDAGPRYFAVLVLPVMLIVLLFQGELERMRPALGRACGVLILVAVGLNIALIGRMLVHPAYTLRDADVAILRQIEAEPAATALVIGHGAAESTLVTHVPALDDLGAMPLDAKLAQFHPGWLVAYSSDVEIMSRPSIVGKYRFLERGKYFVFDLPERQYLLLYRIEPVPGR